MSAGGSSGSSDSRFERKGVVNTTSFRDLTPDQNSKFDTAFGATQPGSANGAVNGLLENRMGTQTQDTPYQPELCQLIRSNLPSTGLVGQDSLKAQASVNPYDSAFAENTFNRYATEVGKAQSVARSGPQMTRGGTAAQGFAQAEVANDVGMNREQVLAGNRQADASISQNAANSFGQLLSSKNMDSLRGVGQSHQNYHANTGTQLNAAGLSSERLKMYNDLVPTFTSLASAMNGTETNDLTGRGSQGSQSVGMGVNLCCFIFMESYNGNLPWYVRAYRDQHAAENTPRRLGYVRMSRWLVPAMRTSRTVRTLTNWLLVRPLTCYGKWKLAGGRIGWLFRPLVSFWFKVWETIGKENKV